MPSLRDSAEVLIALAALGGYLAWKRLSAFSAPLLSLPELLKIPSPYLILAAAALGVSLLAVRARVRVADLQATAWRGKVLVNVGGRRLLLAVLRVVPRPREEGEDPATVDLNSLMEEASAAGLGLAFFGAISPVRLRVAGRTLLGGAREGVVVLWSDANDLRQAEARIEAGARMVAAKLSDSFRLRRLDGARAAWLALAIVGGSPRGAEAPERVAPAEPNVVESPGFVLGETLGGEPVVITEEDLRNHVVVAGQTGSGKSTTLARLVEGVARELGIPVLVIDVHGEHGYLTRLGGRVFRVGVPGGLGVNLLSGLAEKSDEELREITETFATALEFTPPQYAMFVRVLERAREKARAGEEVKLSSLLEILKTLPRRGQAEYEVKAALFRRLAPVATPEADLAFSHPRGIPLDELMSGLSVIQLNAMRSERAWRIFVHALLREIYRRAISRGLATSLREVLVIEEGDRLVPEVRSGPGAVNVVERIFSELRKFGVGAVIAATDLASLSGRIYGNSAVKVIHPVSSDESARRLREFLGATVRDADRLVRELKTLPPGHALVVKRGSARWQWIRVIRPALYTLSPPPAGGSRWG